MCVTIMSWVPIDAKTHLGHHHHKHVSQTIHNKHDEIKHDKKEVQILLIGIILIFASSV